MRLKLNAAAKITNSKVTNSQSIIYYIRSVCVTTIQKYKIPQNCLRQTQVSSSYYHGVLLILSKAYHDI